MISRNVSEIKSVGKIHMDGHTFASLYTVRKVVHSSEVKLYWYYIGRSIITSKCPLYGGILNMSFIEVVLNLIEVLLQNTHITDPVFYC